MSLTLAISVQFHDGFYYGEREPSVGEWPPAPGRLFQALTAAAANGVVMDDAHEEALKWLEELDEPPIIAAPSAHKGQPYSNFVPNNDRDAVDGGKKNLNEIRAAKTMRPHIFDMEIPVLFFWSFSGADRERIHAQTICQVAEKLYQLGRGVDMAWAWAEILEQCEVEARLSSYSGAIYRSTGGSESIVLSCPLKGSLSSLETRFKYERFKRNPSGRAPRQQFAQAPTGRFARVAYNAPPRRLVFALREGDARAGFARRRLNEAAALVAEVRDQVAARLCDAVPEQEDDVARYLIGRGATDADKALRVRIVPIPSIGHPHADMAIRRLTVYVPQSCPLRADDLAWAFAQVTWTDSDGVVTSELQRADDDSMATRYEDAGRHWRSVTPLALTTARRRRIDPERASKEAKDGDERAREEARAVHAARQALRHVGVRNSPTAVRVQREPFDGHGERVEVFAADTRFAKESLWHVAVTFAEPVTGPLQLGDGRYLGLGLMCPVDPKPDVLAFAIKAGLANDADPALVAQAARRAMLARMQTILPRGQSIPRYVSGHEDDGSPASSGTHRHIAVVPDLPRRRLLFVAPSLLQRGGVSWQRVRDDHAGVERALEGMTVLRAGQAGRLVLTPAALSAESDPLFAPSQVWESVSDYRVTRHLRRRGDEEALRADVLAELDRIGWPVPASVEVLSVRRGSRGGLSGRLRLSFAAVQEGPLMIGRTAHKGGGLFQPRR